jgi:lincosamide nucleotidyltransferase A/C/D/E
MDEADVVDLLDAMEAEQADFWVDGGWGVDALLGEQTRHHADLDLVMHRDDLRRVCAVLSERGYQVVRNWLPTAIALRDSVGREVDLHPVNPTSDGGGDQIQLDGKSSYHYSSPVEGTIGGRAVRCCSLRDQVHCHLGYDPREVDRLDMRRLSQHFGLTFPEPYAQT